MNKNNNFKINFIGIGAEKAGTTWIADCLKEHPEACLAKGKELFFFNEYDPHYLKVKNIKYSDQGFNWYKKQFKHAKGNQIKGEYSPTYLYCQKAPHRIKKYFPNIKLIVILRDPVARAFSQYIHDLKIGLIKKISFPEALKKYDNYIKKGYYSKYLKNYYALFPHENIIVVLFDDMKNNPSKTIKKIYNFLGLDNIDFKPRQLYKKSNPAVKPKLTLLNFFMIQTEYFLKNKKLYKMHKLLETTGIRKLALAIRDLNTSPLSSYPTIDKHSKKILTDKYAMEIEQLAKLINRDLTSWNK